MGWLYTLGQTRKELIEKRTTRWTTKAASASCVAHCTRGNVLWTVWEVYTRSTGQLNRFIGCDLMQKYNGWGYKDMDESMHPYYYSCPLKYLRMVPHILSKEWRVGVINYHEYQKQRRVILKRRKAQ